MNAEARIAELGIVLPQAVPPAFQYVSVVVHRGTAWVSGQIPRQGDKVLFTGKLGAGVSMDQAKLAAEACVLQALSQLRDVLGSLDRVERILKVTGFVASAEGFAQQPQVVDAASALLVKVFGEQGRHARSAIGVAELPRGVPVEVEMVVALVE
jgi:enamine deaminase RidA (YjgF/YER057c/UK114 family)